MSLNRQEELCKAYITSVGWNIKKEYSDSCKTDVNLYDRPGIKQLSQDLKKQDTTGYALVVFSPDIFGMDMEQAARFFETLQNSNMLIFWVENKTSTILSSALMTLQMRNILNIYTRDKVKDVYLVFSVNDRGPDTYKGSFVNTGELKNFLLLNCKEDKHLSIRLLSDMNNPWEYKSASTIFDEIDNCVQQF